MGVRAIAASFTYPYVDAGLLTLRNCMKFIFNIIIILGKYVNNKILKCRSVSTGSIGRLVVSEVLIFEHICEIAQFELILCLIDKLFCHGIRNNVFRIELLLLLLLLHNWVLLLLLVVTIVRLLVCIIVVIGINVCLILLRRILLVLLRVVVIDRHIIEVRLILVLVGLVDLLLLVMILQFVEEVSLWVSRREVIVVWASAIVVLILLLRILVERGVVVGRSILLNRCLHVSGRRRRHLGTRGYHVFRELLLEGCRHT